MTKKGTTGQKLAKGESLYTPNLIARAGVIIIEAQLIKTDGSLNYTKIAKILDVPARTFSYWRNPESDYYKPELVRAMTKAHKELTEGIDLKKINTGVILRAQGRAKEITVVKEPVVEGPELPAFSRFTKTDLIDYAKQELKIPLKPKLTKGAIEMAIRRRVKKMTTEKMKTIRRVEKTQPTDIAAAKYANQNLGAQDERWKDTQNLDVESKSLVDIIAKTGILGKKKKNKK